MLPLFIRPDADPQLRQHLLTCHPQLVCHELLDERDWRRAPVDGLTVLWLDAQGLGLRRREAQHPGVVRVDFAQAAWQHRLAGRGGAGELVVRACGVRPGRLPRVLDLTAGFGADAWILASQGLSVDLQERSPWVALLLADGLRRALASPDLQATARRMRLQEGDSQSLLASLQPGDYDTLYLDPMFPDVTATARSGKAMSLLQHLVGADSDADALFAAARRLGARIVVKRPRLAPTLGGLAPSHILSGKSVRFDIYAATFRDDAGA